MGLGLVLVIVALLSRTPHYFRPTIKSLSVPNYKLKNNLILYRAIIFGDGSYDDHLKAAGLPTLLERRLLPLRGLLQKK